MFPKSQPRSSFHPPFSVFHSVYPLRKPRHQSCRGSTVGALLAAYPGLTEHAASVPCVSCKGVIRPRRLIRAGLGFSALFLAKLLQKVTPGVTE